MNFTITVERFDKICGVFAYIYRCDKTVPVESFHTYFDGDAGIEKVRALAHEWLAQRFSLTPVAAEAACAPTSEDDGETRRPAEHDG